MFEMEGETCRPQVNAEGPHENRELDEVSDGVRGGTVVVKPGPAAVHTFWRSVRFLVVTLLGFLGTLNLLAVRVNISIALPCMVFINDKKHVVLHLPNSTASSLAPSHTLSASGCVRPEALIADNKTASTSSNVRFSLRLALLG